MKRQIRWGNLIKCLLKQTIVVALIVWFLFSWGEVIYHNDHCDYEYSKINIISLIFDREV